MRFIQAQNVQNSMPAGAYSQTPYLDLGKKAPRKETRIGDNNEIKSRKKEGKRRRDEVICSNGSRGNRRPC